MGQFSWLDCIDETQIKDDVHDDVYLLIPAKFGGGHIHETCYDGYGRFGGKDVYDLIPVWNKDMIPEIIRRYHNGTWAAHINEKELLAYYNGEEITCPLRYLGINMACYDEDNAALEYPIKITHNARAVYEDCRPSKSDPDQGW